MSVNIVELCISRVEGDFWLEVCNYIRGNGTDDHLCIYANVIMNESQDKMCVDGEHCE